MSGEKISVGVLAPADPSNPKGSRTFEWKFDDNRQITIYRRKAGELAGGHYHKGNDPAKNPELFLLLSGRVHVRMEDLDGMQNEYTLDADLNGPTEVVIQPYLLHFFTGLTDIEYIEYRVGHFDPNNPDTYPEEEFYQES